MKAETSSFLAAAAPFLRDLEGWYPGLLRIEPTPDDPDWSGFAWDVDGCGTGLYCSAGLQPEEAVAELADALQEAVIEGLWGTGARTNWPPCPEHPNRHPLAPDSRDDHAVWVCPATRALVAQIGRLPRPNRS